MNFRSAKHKITSNAIVKASAGVFLVMLLVKVIGYGEKVILAYYFGTGPEVDVYQVISTVVLSIFVFFREIIEPAFLNLFFAGRDEKGTIAAYKVFNLLGRIILVSTVCLTLLVEFAPAPAIDLFAPGFGEEKKSIALNMIRIAFPACVFLSLSSLTGIALNAEKKFVFPAAADLVFRGVTLMSLIALTPYLGFYSVAIGLLLGAAGKLLLHLSKLHRFISFKKVNLLPAQRNDLFYLTWPLLLGISFSQFNGIIDNVFASYLEDGAIAALSYAKKVVELPILIFPYLLSTVLFPFLTESHMTGHNDRARALLTSSIKCIVVFFVPLSIFFLMYSDSVIGIIFQRGAFTASSTMLTEQPFFIYAFGLVFFAVETILVIYFFSRNSTLLPILVGIGCVIINIAITYLSIEQVGYLAIPLAAVASKGLKVVILSSIIMKREKIFLGTVASFFGKVLVGAALFYSCHLMINFLFVFDYSSMVMRLIHMMMAFLVALLLYSISTYRFKLLHGLTLS